MPLVGLAIKTMRPPIIVGKTLITHRFSAEGHLMTAIRLDCVAFEFWMKCACRAIVPCGRCWTTDIPNDLSVLIDYVVATHYGFTNFSKAIFAMSSGRADFLISSTECHPGKVSLTVAFTKAAHCAFLPTKFIAR